MEKGKLRASPSAQLLLDFFLTPRFSPSRRRQLHTLLLMVTAIAADEKREAHHAMQHLALRRKELDAEFQEKEAELERKRKSYLDELAGVKADRDHLKERLAKILKGSVDHWEKEGNEGAAKRRKKQLKKLEEEGLDDRVE